MLVREITQAMQRRVHPPEGAWDLDLGEYNGAMNAYAHMLTLIDDMEGQD
jgi:hypothetical protein